MNVLRIPVRRRGAARIRPFAAGLVLVSLSALTPGTATAQEQIEGPVLTATMPFTPGHASADGFESGTMEVRYRFLTCGRALFVVYSPQGSSIQAGSAYWYRGDRVAVPAAIPAPRYTNSVPLSGVAIRDRVQLGRFGDSFATVNVTGMGCWSGNAKQVAPLPEHLLRADAAQVQGYLGTIIATFSTGSRLTSGAVESMILEERREAERQRLAEERRIEEARRAEERRQQEERQAEERRQQEERQAEARQQQEQQEQQQAAAAAQQVEAAQAAARQQEDARRREAAERAERAAAERRAEEARRQEEERLRGRAELGAGTSHILAGAIADGHRVGLTTNQLRPSGGLPVRTFGFTTNIMGPFTYLNLGANLAFLGYLFADTAEEADAAIDDEPTALVFNVITGTQLLVLSLGPLQLAPAIEAGMVMGFDLESTSMFFGGPGLILRWGPLDLIASMSIMTSTYNYSLGTAIQF